MRALDRTDHVITTLHDRGRNVRDQVRIAQQLVIHLKEAAVHEVVTLNAREGQRLGIRAKISGEGRIRQELARGPFPDAPRARSGHVHGGIVAEQTLGVGLHQRVAFRGWNRGEVVLPCIGIEPAAAALLIEPDQLGTPQQEDAAQHKLGHARGMTLCVREGQCAAPRAAEHLPALDLQVLAHALQVGNQVPGRVLLNASVGRALPAAALVDQDDPVPARIKEAPVLRAGAAARTTMQKHHGFACGVARLLPIDVMQS